MADETTPFQIGDVVQLKSGGALMTVYGLEKASVYVYFADAQGLPQQRTNSLPMAVLKKVDAPTSKGADASGDIYTDAYPN